MAIATTRAIREAARAERLKRSNDLERSI